jgi:hypothetical protein
MSKKKPVVPAVAPEKDIPETASEDTSPEVTPENTMEVKSESVFPDVVWKASIGGKKIIDVKFDGPYVLITDEVRSTFKLPRAEYDLLPDQD